MRSGRIEITARALAPIVHTSGVAGNTSILRVQDLADGARVPFVSGNSFKGRLRRAGAAFALTAMGVGRELQKSLVDLLFSGGHLSKAGQAVNLERAREMERLFPLLSLMGYSAGNVMTESKVTCRHWHLVCHENTFRLPEGVVATARAGQLITSDFGTRREMGTSVIANQFLLGTEQQRVITEKSRKLAAKESSKGDSSQMIYEFQAISAGAELFSGLFYQDLSALEWCALLTCLWAITKEIRGDQAIWQLGGKGAVGYGEVAVTLKGVVVPAIAPDCPDSEAMEAAVGGAAGEYVKHLRDHRDEILDFLGGCV